MPIKIDKYTHKIEPDGGKVEATVYHHTVYTDGTTFNIPLVSKRFGSMFRGISQKDYEDAKDWVNFHLDNIEKLNNQHNGHENKQRHHP